MNRPILVGIDESQTSKCAVTWAAGEAARRGTGLRLLHAIPWPLLDLPTDPRQPGIGDAAERLLAEAEDQAQRLAPELQITREVSAESPAAALINSAADADLVVVGNRGHGGFVGLLVGSVALQVSGHAPCPVVLVPQETHDDHQEIVVGVGAGLADAPFRRAFDEAEIHNAPLRFVHAWWSPPAFAPGIPVPPVSDAPEVRQAIEGRVRTAVAAWHQKHPTAAVTVDVVNSDPREVLLDTARDAALIIVGAHDDDGRHLRPLGSIASSVVHHSPCPVLIAR